MYQRLVWFWTRPASMAILAGWVLYAVFTAPSEGGYGGMAACIVAFILSASVAYEADCRWRWFARMAAWLRDRPDNLRVAGASLALLAAILAASVPMSFAADFSKEPAVLMVSEAIVHWGGVLIFIGGSIRMFHVIARGLPLTATSNMLWLSARRFLYIGVVASAVILLGDTVLDAYHHNPAALVGAGVVITSIALAFNLAGRRKETAMTLDPAVPAVAVMAVRSSPTDRDEEVTAYHEAGHALMFAATSDLPASWSASVERDEGSLGRVSALTPADHLWSLPFLRWQMMCFLAGREAELIKFGVAHDGCGSDLERWEEAARRYLRAGGDELHWFRTPQSSDEVDANRRALTDLRVQQAKSVRKFLLVNHELLVELAESLKVRREMSSKEIAPILRRATLTDDFPQFEVAMTS